MREIFETYIQVFLSSPFLICTLSALSMDLQAQLPLLFHPPFECRGYLRVISIDCALALDREWAAEVAAFDHCCR